jgi:succinyl-CoA synthetase beta subunit
VLLLEHEGKDLLRDYDIPVPNGLVVLPGDAPPDAVPLPAVVKAQVPVGARGKAGGIRTVNDQAELRAAIDSLFRTPIRDHKVEAILVEPKVAMRHERYLGILMDGEEILLIIGRVGGIEVEELANGDTGNFAVARIDPAYGLGEHQVRTALDELGIPAKLWGGYVEIALRLARLFRERDAVLAEINPLAELEGGALVALDARIKVDPGAFFRQPRFAEIERRRISEDNLQARMNELQIQYVPMGGAVGLLSSGAGVGVTVMDWVALEGQKLAAFIDIDYAIMAGNTEAAIRLVLDVLEADPNVRSIIVNFTTCGLRLDAIAETLRDVLVARADGGKPVSLHLQGNRAAQAHDILRGAGFPVIDKLGDAVRHAVRAAGAPQ